MMRSTSWQLWGLLILGACHSSQGAPEASDEFSEIDGVTGKSDSAGHGHCADNLANSQADLSDEEREHYALARFKLGRPGLADRRQLPQGYWLSQMIHVSDLADLEEDGVRLILTLHRTDDETTAALSESEHIEQRMILMGNDFTRSHVKRIEEAIEGVPPEQILIHCINGADRTGAVAAYLLATRHDFSPGDALFSVVAVANDHMAALRDILDQAGESEDFSDRRKGDGKTGIYSTWGPRCVGGHKTTGKYGNLTRTTIDAIHLTK